MKQLFLTPLDVLYLRGNRLFGEAGDDALAVMPPWPSVAAGAIRSRMLTDAREELRAFAKDGTINNQKLAAVLGTPQAPGTFRVCSFAVAQWNRGALELVVPMPADCYCFDDGFVQSEPATLPASVCGNSATLAVPVLRRSRVQKANHIYWLNQAGLAAYVRGEPLLQHEHTVEVKDLWKTDARLGIGMDPQSRKADDGKIYTSDAIAVKEGVGFIVGIEGADDCLPLNGLLRFGGDGRAVDIATVSVDWPQPDWADITKNKRFKLLLTSPGIFPDGWKLPGMRDDRWFIGDASARLVAASVARSEVVSGWDVAAHAPKPAENVVPRGSVYWLDDWQGDIALLKKLCAKGLPCTEKKRSAEGFNHCMVVNWKGNEHV